MNEFGNTQYEEPPEKDVKRSTFSLSSYSDFPMQVVFVVER